MGIAQIQQHARRADDSGNQRRNGHAFHAAVQHVNAQRVTDDVDRVDDERDDHRHSRSVHGSAQRRAGVVQRDERIGRRRDGQIGQSVVEHILLHGAEHQREQLALERQHRNHDDQRNAQRHQHQLVGRLAGLIPALRAQHLRRHHRTARGQRREQRQQHVAQLIHQRNAGYRRLAQTGYHHRVRHAHQHHQRLLDEQRNQQIPQLAVGIQLYLLSLHENLSINFRSSSPQTKAFGDGPGSSAGQRRLAYQITSCQRPCFQPVSFCTPKRS